jgi:hypothetical protein
MKDAELNDKLRYGTGTLFWKKDQLLKLKMQSLIDKLRYRIRYIILAKKDFRIANFQSK